MPLTSAGTTHLSDRDPQVSGAEMVAALVPPPQFDEATFDTYRADADYPSQQEAKDLLERFAGARGSTPARGGFFRRAKREPEMQPGVYLDGGFGVGKTHLLAAIYHAMPARRKYFGSFIEYTALVGALGYQKTVELFRGADLLCIDEFELDDPGDTMVMTRLIAELVPTGTKLAATSNTPPNALGEGRFAAQDFLREIHAMAEHFQTIRIDGTDYRQRAVDGHAVVLDDAAYRTTMTDAAASTLVSDDDFGSFIRHLASVHPSRYIRLIEGVGAIGLRDVAGFDDQSAALRFVAFVDRAYDAQIPIRATGTALDQVFREDMLNGGYRKKYLRAISRLVALTHS
ncbi:cell division protein ZapE [Microbacterium sp. EYE_5]|uniref:cell division protein ZapE n=1 Tax=unclassified Microbacterium TaxID=2609290 RepID=UPI002005C054|nr:MULTISPECIES: cell division protein ZapE [unclassified Microbacterium]MCK6080686.1 cell division protein ZapE [Microbacterium sp. EYE_382]MCK6085957.1 cell division protein ZapE [Microbacterium sp. EYE_384]MCK6124545.1 cell division protein ZapE [Microbacterium sp. EYE_80]MCK6127454.1 cell division protein ZapE [Microbacterium sp. EYE_79]MCK6141641.1 cell division protein ZapE [Microbacterium sp. EYE_39]